MRVPCCCAFCSSSLKRGAQGLKRVENGGGGLAPAPPAVGALPSSRWQVQQEEQQRRQRLVAAATTASCCGAAAGSTDAGRDGADEHLRRRNLHGWRQARRRRKLIATAGGPGRKELTPVSGSLAHHTRQRGRQPLRPMSARFEHNPALLRPVKHARPHVSRVAVTLCDDC